jgi:hypothetical protein
MAGGDCNIDNNKQNTTKTPNPPTTSMICVSSLPSARAIQLPSLAASILINPIAFESSLRNANDSSGFPHQALTRSCCNSNRDGYSECLAKRMNPRKQVGRMFVVMVLAAGLSQPLRTVGRIASCSDAGRQRFAGSPRLTSPRRRNPMRNCSGRWNRPSRGPCPPPCSRSWNWNPGVRREERFNENSP